MEVAMSRIRTASAWPGALLLLGIAGSAEAQYPLTRDRSTSTVGTRFGDTTSTAGPAPAPATGAVRELVCRGAEGLQVATVANPSPRNSRQVAVSLSYRRNPRPAGSAYEQLEPGACSWNITGDPSLPAEPGIVHFDLEPQGAEYIPDPASLTQWLNNPRHYWTFYVDDLTNVSISHGAYGARFQAPAGDKPTATRPAAQRRERLRCRGGGAATFTQGKRIGPNLFAVTLSYKAASTAAGPIGKGLQPGTCAWADRTDAPAEPGRIEFTTARNAQREQEKSGAPVDSSATAAERWPDLRTIPAYMTDPAHYWTFNVSLMNPDSALRHGAWIPTAPEAPDPPSPGPVATTPSGDSPYTSTSPSGARTTVSLPGGGGSTIEERYTPGAGNATVTDPRIVFDIRNVQVRTGLDGASISFEAAPNLVPVVSVSTAAPEGTEGGQRFSGPSTRLTVSGTPTGGTRWRYSAASGTPLARGTRYWFIAEAPEGPNSRYNQVTGEFRTLAQRVTVTVSDIQVVSDGDAESDGDLWFTVRTCPDRLFPESDLIGDFKNRVQWSEGRHTVNREVTSAPTSAPDKFRVLIVGIEDDYDVASGFGSRDPFQVWFSCERGGNLEPKKTAKAEWNAVIMDLDLSRYPGTKATEQFVRRSQPLQNGSTLMFEVRGYVTVTRE
jgi:hypothetical protein